MTEADKKRLVVGVGALFVVTVVLARTGSVLVEFARSRAAGEERRELECEARLERVAERPSPLPGYRAAQVYRRTSPPPSAIRLATLRLPGRTSAHERVLNSDHLLYTCVYRAAAEIGGNALMPERVEPGASNGEESTFVAGVYLVVAPLPPAPFAARFETRVAVVTDVSPDSAAERAGLRPGDLLVDLDHHGLGEGGGKESTEVNDAINALGDGVEAVLTVVRGGGQVLDLRVTKEHGKLGFNYLAAPISPGR